MTKDVLVKDLQTIITELQGKNSILENRERELFERTEELLAQKEDLTAAIEAFMEKSDALEESVTTLRHRNFELDQILYRTSHDLRAPLTSIDGLVRILKSQDHSASTHEILEHLSLQSGQMKEVLNSLSGLAHASFSKIDYAREPGI